VLLVNFRILFLLKLFLYFKFGETELYISNELLKLILFIQSTSRNWLVEIVRKERVISYNKKFGKFLLFNGKIFIVFNQPNLFS